jgi:polyhydroxyalkanoate synthesis regulator phasin
MPNTDADRNLLFGLIALQNGLIDQDQLVAAFGAWSRDKARRLVDHLADRGDLDAEQRAAVNALVALHLKKHGDDPEKSLAAMAAGPSTRERLNRLCDSDIETSIAHVGSGSNGDVVQTHAHSLGIATSEGQRFRVLRPHAQGGLGAVFVALDEELHREVALKEILDRHADDPVSRSRFLLEAEITGGLEHPGIVPVYGLGTYAGGRPYYAMRFIRGDSLKEAIERFHADPLADEGIKVRSPASVVTSAWPIGLARPQSITSVSPCRPMITLPGLMSRCRMPRLWAYSIALHTSVNRRSSLRSSNDRAPLSRFSRASAWNRSIASLRLSPRTNRMA